MGVRYIENKMREHADNSAEAKNANSLLLIVLLGSFFVKHFVSFFGGGQFKCLNM
jgi:hypothetical protein